MATLRPLGDKLLVTPFYQEKTVSGIVIINEKERHILMGLDKVFWVVAVGPKVQGVKPKDRVMCKFDEAGIDMLTDGTKRGFIRQHDILAVLPQQQD